MVPQDFCSRFFQKRFFNTSLLCILSPESPVRPMIPIKIATMKLETAQASAFLRHREDRESLNPLSTKSDQHEISLYNITALENRLVMRIKNMIREDESN